MKLSVKFLHVSQKVWKRHVLQYAVYLKWKQKPHVQAVRQKSDYWRVCSSRIFSQKFKSGPYCWKFFNYKTSASTFFLKYLV